MDSDEEKKFKIRFKENRQRIRFRQKEMDEDEMERKKELLQFIPQEPQNDIDRLRPDYEQGEDMDVEDDKPHFVIQREEIEIQEQQHKNQQDGMKLNFQGGQNQGQNRPTDDNVFGEDDDRQEEIAQPKKLNLPKIGNQQRRADEQQKQMEEQQKKQEKKGEDSDSEEERRKAEQLKEELKNLIRQIPNNKKDLFKYELDWQLLAKSDILEKKVRPWLLQKSVEYLKEEEQNFVKMIIKKLNNKETPQNVLKKVQIILDDDAEEFVIKLWRMLIFELLKAQKELI